MAGHGETGVILGYAQLDAYSVLALDHFKETKQVKVITTRDLTLHPDVFPLTELDLEDQDLERDGKYLSPMVAHAHPWD